MWGDHQAQNKHDSDQYKDIPFASTEALANILLVCVLPVMANALNRTILSVCTRERLHSVLIFFF